MELKTFVFNPFYENTYLLYDENKEAVIVDPGCYEKFEQDELISFIHENDIKPLAILNTHCHIDHVLGNAFLKRHYGIPLWIPENEQEMFRSVEAYAFNWGIANYETSEPDHLYAEDETFELGDSSIRFIYAPGHSPGHMMLYIDKDATLIAGDVIFRESIGRSDLPGGDYATLESSIKQKVYTLPKDTNIFPGHGPQTTVGYEMMNNPFVKG